MVEDFINSIKNRAFSLASRTDMADIAPVELPSVATAAEIADAEKYMGIAFPELLGTLFTSIANGGFGPGYGLIGLQGGQLDDQGRSITDLYSAFHQDIPVLSKAILPCCDWGGGVWSCIDCIDDKDLMVTISEYGVTNTGVPFLEWMQRWASGESLWDSMFEFSKASLRHPLTGKPVDTLVRGKPIGTDHQPF